MKKKDISYINGADHTYSNQESILANQICIFLRKI